MSELNSKPDNKRKSIVASEETKETFKKIVAKSGKTESEFFEELVNNLAMQDVVNNEQIPTDLRKHYESDVQKLKNATNSIVSIFVSQMENISVEKNQWQVLTEKQVNEKQVKIEELSSKFNELQTQFDESKQKLTELTKINDTLTKEQDTLVKRTQDQEQLIHDRAEKIEDLQERINKLNENIVDKDERLKAIEPIKQELNKLKETVQHLTQEKEQLVKKHEDELKRAKETLLFECEKAKHQLEMELTQKFIKEKEELRNEVRKETEKNIREFYLAEIKRKDLEFKAQEEEFEAREAEFRTKEEEFKAKESEFLAKEEEYTHKLKLQGDLGNVMNAIKRPINTKGKPKPKQE